MLLRVSKKVGMWGYGCLWFTFADPRPQNINLDELDETTRDKVNAALRDGILEQTDKVGNTVSAKVEPVTPTSISRPVFDKTQLTYGAQVSPVIAKKLGDLLKNGVTTLRKEISSVKSQQMLSALLEMEKNDKNRKTVVAMILKEIDKTPSLQKYDDLIEEEEVEVIKFNMENLIVPDIDEEITIDSPMDHKQ